MENQKTRLTFPVKSFKRFDNPYNTKDNPAKYQFFIDAKDIPEDLESWLDVNPREQNLNTDVAHSIKESLINEDLTFHLLNRGLLISAEEITYNNATHTADMILSDITQHGIIDGGHTFKILMENKNLIDNDITKYVTFEVITNVSHIEMLAEARNTSVAVDDKSIEELKGSFDCFKKIISDQEIGNDRYFERIAFKQNQYRNDPEKKNIIDAREIITITNMFNPYLYNPNAAQHPIQSYTGKEVSLQRFLRLADRNSEKDIDYRNKAISNMSEIINDIFLLWDKIECEFPQVSKDLKKRYGSKKYSNYGNNKVKKIALFSNIDLEYTVPKGIMYPCLGAFRALVKQDARTGVCTWAIDPFEVWNDKKESIVTTILDNSKSLAGDSPDQIGKSSLIWDSLYNSIFIYRLMKKV